jgi:PKD repeat protein
MKKYLILAFIALAGIVASAQNEVKFCGQTEQTEKLFERFHGLETEAARATAELEAETQAYGTSRVGGDEIMIVPVVFHIIHVGGEENISDAQVHTAIDVLNEDFRALNENLEDVVEEFVPVIGDVGIEFRLAQKDPNGNCHKGITRHYDSQTYVGDDDVKDIVMWPRNKYLNVWVCMDAGGAIGYSYLPGSVSGWQGADIDGIVIRHNYTGRIGTSNQTRSSTLPHEVGHWLNLYHTWGPGNSPAEPDNCDIDDNVNDTPQCTGWWSCSLTAESCGSLDNVQNYMDYAGCRRMFTEGQANRMRSALMSNTAQRNQLWTENNLQNTGVWNDELLLCDAEFEANKKVICVGEEIQFTDVSYHGVSDWSWDFGDGEQLEGNDPEVHKNPVHTYAEPGVYSVMLTASNGIEETSTAVEGFITVLAPGFMAPPFVEGFEGSFPSDRWFVENFDEAEEWFVTDAASYSGDRCIKMLNNVNDIVPNYDNIYTSTFDVTDHEEVTISYKWAHVNRFPATDDRLRVSISPDCGESWYLKKIHRGLTDLPTANATNLSWTPQSTDDWTGNSIVVNVPSQLTETFQVKFELEAHGGNNLYLDDINITGSNPNSIEVISIEDVAMHVWPNPMSDNGTIRFSSSTSRELSLVVTDVVGKTVLNLFSGTIQAGESTFDLNTASLSAGSYFVVASNSSGKVVERIVVR